MSDRRRRDGERHPPTTAFAALAALTVAAVVLCACGSGAKTAGVVTTPPPGTAPEVTSATSVTPVTPPSTGAPPKISVVTIGGVVPQPSPSLSSAPDEPTTEPAPEPATDEPQPPATAEAQPLTTAPPKVTVVIIGSVNGGQGGGVGVGSTDSASEMVREEDGTCQGWDGRRATGLWTQDVKGGAPIVIVDGKTGAELATGTLAAGKAENVATGSDEQWQCAFAFTVPDVPKAASYAVKVGRHGPWPLQVDPARAGAFAVSVATVASSEGISACDPNGALPSEVGEWRAVGQYWNNGIASICSAGLRVPARNGVARRCRPAGIASDRVVSVVDKANPKLVYEEAGGLKVDLKTLRPGTEVVVNVATGIACTS